MTKIPMLLMLLLVVSLLSSCSINTMQDKESNIGTQSTMPTADATANSPSLSETNPPTDPSAKSPLFSTISPDNKIKIEFTADETKTDIGLLKLIDIQTDDTLITYEYPSNAEFFPIWSSDSYYCAIGYKNDKESRTAIYIAKTGISSTGKAIYSPGILSFTDTIHPDNSEADIKPVEFIDENTLLLYIGWIDKDGTQNDCTTKWDFLHGTYTDLEKQVK